MSWSRIMDTEYVKMWRAHCEKQEQKEIEGIAWRKNYGGKIKWRLV